ncbi:hypothetical protein MAC_06611 [Metarhizium acridum CQMa 102]|uniref:Uncharacterized protein n=1 Tax=Metarhizium acridum (strain CQMa 102) TaxID=655827 RepID=E9E9R3_METAQ|nr:uncharacterized protein MAC_06611 [Metarhizium acridum CQMa 102]EFY87376.1 hypothetical protein MAC_06611 [Metarhizium acridum CQMa 102]
MLVVTPTVVLSACLCGVGRPNFHVCKALTDIGHAKQHSSVMILDMAIFGAAQSGLIAYADEQPEAHPPADFDTTTAFTHLSLEKHISGRKLTVDTCLAHLRLLHAIHNLKEEVGYSDGLFGLYDNFADDVAAVLDLDAILAMKGIVIEDAKKLKLALNKIREKGWSMIVARAVDRNETWWMVFRGQNYLTEDMMREPASELYSNFPILCKDPRGLGQDMPPPLEGVLWPLANEAIDTNFDYSVSEGRQNRWMQATGRCWAIADDPVVKIIKCPHCKSPNHIPWTTWGDEEKTNREDGLSGLVGSGIWGRPCLFLDLRIKIQDIFKSHRDPTMETVKPLVEGVLRDPDRHCRIDSLPPGSRLLTEIPPTSQTRVQKMISQYWKNFSAFALDLCGAVMRQGLFVDKMVKLDWLHSPSARDTMARLITKYHNCMKLMELHPKQVAVSTLDVDLACECTCWYCEATRAPHASSSFWRSLFRTSSGDKVAEGFHQSGRAGRCPPDNSAHNAVRSVEWSTKMAWANLCLHQQYFLEKNYQKAVERAQKRAVSFLRPRTIMTIGAIHISHRGWEPGYVHTGAGAWGLCAAGSCGRGGIAAGQCGNAVWGGAVVEHGYQSCGSGTGGCGTGYPLRISYSH